MIEVRMYGYYSTSNPFAFLPIHSLILTYLLNENHVQDLLILLNLVLSIFLMQEVSNIFTSLSLLLLRLAAIFLSFISLVFIFLQLTDLFFKRQNTGIVLLLSCLYLFFSFCIFIALILQQTVFLLLLEYFLNTE